ncbi:nucleoside 2-deoxyribosyltransferase [Streptomyces sp. NPDC057909]|uniref:nucleoside 2-deoxyribosyltransferase n=1 Tax=Streptomyces sp. NPDC057909 TaxID=3346277 RepID=UPI0036E5C9A1
MTQHTEKPVVFIGGPFKAAVDPETGILSHELQGRYRKLIGFYEENGWEVLSAHREEGWGLEMVPASVCTERDFRWMGSCDLFVAFPGDPASPGTHVEIGWGSAMGRPMILLLEEQGRHAALVTGLGGVAPATTYLTYDEGPGFMASLAQATADLGDRLGAGWPRAALADAR